MAIIPKLLDPVQGLVDYVKAIKPYHTKIFEVLEEYVHTDNIYATLSDDIKFCINLGYPNLNTLFSFDIINVDIINNSVTVQGKIDQNINIGQKISIEFSSHNDNLYYVTNIEFNSIENNSIIFLQGDLTTNIADGKIVHSVIQYCPSGNNKTTNVLNTSSMYCEEGYGNIYDSIIEQVSSIDLPLNQITIVGDHTLQLNNTTSVQLINNLLSEPDNPMLNEYWISGTDLFKYDGAEWIQKLVLLSQPIVPQLNDYWINGITLLQYQQVGPALFDWVILNSYRDLDIIAVLHFDSFVYNGTETVINIKETISTYPRFNINDSYKLLISYIGYDEVIKCNFNNDPNTSETLFVTMKESFDFDIGINYVDGFTVYNMENSYESSYDSLRLGQIDSILEPIIIESIIAPANPNVFDLWYDENVYKLKQWYNYDWVPIQFVYWYKEDINNNQIVNHYKLIKNQFENTGWVEVDPQLNDYIPVGFDNDPYSIIKNTHIHPIGQVAYNIPLNGIYLLGGNYIPYLLYNKTVKTYNNDSYISNINYVSYDIESYNSNSITLSNASGDISDIFVPGVLFTVQDPGLITKYFNVKGSTYDGQNTIIEVFENVSYNGFTSTTLGTIPGIFYLQPKINTDIDYDGGYFDGTGTIGPDINGSPILNINSPVINGGSFLSSSSSTIGTDGISTLIILDTVVDTSTNYVEYKYFGPLQIDIDLFRNSHFEMDVNDNLYDNNTIHTQPNVLTNTCLNCIYITGGNYIHNLITTNIIKSYIDNLYIDDINYMEYFIESYDTYVIVLSELSGDLTNIFVPGVTFYVQDDNLSNNYFNVNDSSYDGQNTIIDVFESVTSGGFNNTNVGYIPGVFYVQPYTIDYYDGGYFDGTGTIGPDINGCSLLDINANIISGGQFDNLLSPHLCNDDYDGGYFDGTGTIGPDINGCSLLDINSPVINGGNIGDPIFPHLSIGEPATLIFLDTTVNPNINHIEYKNNGSFQIKDFVVSDNLVSIESNDSSNDQMTTSISDEIVWSWGNISDWFQYYITGFESNSEILLAGNASLDLQVGQQFNIIGNTNNSGTYTILSIIYNGITTNITILETIDMNQLGGYIEPVDILPIRMTLEDNIGVTLTEQNTIPTLI